MANTAQKRLQTRTKRRQRVRRKIRGTAERPRLCVFKSLRFTYAQIISDDSGVVLAAASTKELGEKVAGNKESAKQLGLRIAKIAKEKQIENILFDRNGYRYHGRIAAVAEGAREGGLNF